MTRRNKTTLQPWEKSLPAVAGVTHRLVDIDGLRLHVADPGQGEPLVLLHGWPQHWYRWHALLPKLAEHYRVVCPDIRALSLRLATGVHADPLWHPRHLCLCAPPAWRSG